MSLSVPVELDGAPILNVKNEEKGFFVNALNTHCNLNILDSFKDATHQEPQANSTKLFIYSIQQLYNCYEGSTKQYNDRALHDMEDTMFLNNQNNRGTELRICALSKSAINTRDINQAISDYVATQKTSIPDFISSSIPEIYNYALNDAAITPNDFRPGITEIETPASFIDPGGRGQASIWPPLNKVLTIDLTNFGFHDIQFISKFLEQNICNIIIVKNNIEILNVNVDRKGHILSGSEQQYFEGNVTKNSFLIEAPINLQNQKHALNYVLGKELGDTLQVIIGYIMMKHDPASYESEQSKVAAFTGDIPFACRCMMLNVPVLLRRLKYNSPDSVLRHYSFFIPTSLSEEERNKIVHKSKIDDILKHNNGVKFRIGKFIAEARNPARTNIDIDEYIDRGLRFTNEDKILSSIVELLTTVNSFIDGINRYLTELRNTAFVDDNTDVHEEYRAFDIMTPTKMKNKLKLNPFLDRLMSGINESDPIRNIVKDGNFKNIGEYYKSIKDRVKPSRSARLRGGGHPLTRTAIEIKQTDILDDSYYVFDILFNYYKFVGGTIINSQLISRLITYVIEHKSLPSLMEFRGVYNKFEKQQFDMFENVEKEVMSDGPNIFELNSQFLLNTINEYFINQLPIDSSVPKVSKPISLKKSKATGPNPMMKRFFESSMGEGLTARGLRARGLRARGPTARGSMVGVPMEEDSMGGVPMGGVPMEEDYMSGGGNKNKPRKNKTRKNKTRKIKQKTQK